MFHNASSQQRQHLHGNLCYMLFCFGFARMLFVKKKARSVRFAKR